MVEPADALARRLAGALVRRGLLLASAESSAGGALAEILTRLPGASRWFERGFVAYSDAAKVELLGVQPETIASCGAVSRETVTEMALGALARTPATIVVAESGIAGPGGGSADKPAGMVWVACARRGEAPRVRLHRLGGDRGAVRRQAVAAALQALLELADG